MLKLWKARVVAAALAGGIALAGCFGGGGGDAPAGVVLSGVAAEGAPLAGATIQMVDATGAVVGTGTAGEDGTYSITIPATARAPLVASASKDDTVYYSPVAEAKSGRINITKLTHLIAAQLSATGDPADLASQIKDGAVAVTPTRVAQVVGEVVEALRPLLTNAGDSTDPISGSFQADGTGHDQVLKSLDIAIHRTSDGTASITITAKVVTDETQQPPAITFSSGTKPPPLPQMVATAELPSSDTDALVARYLASLEACYALPVTERVSGNTVVAPACRELFSGNDPATFRNNGNLVGPSGAFSGLFRAGATGVKFTNPVIEFLNPGGKMLLSWRNTSTDGGVAWNRVWVQRENGALKAIGNQYQYGFEVRAWSEKRDLLNTPALSYLATGFDVFVPNLSDGMGNALFSRVVVSTPSGRTLTLLPSSGLSYLAIQNPATQLPTTTSVVRLAGKFLDSATSGVPRRLSQVQNGEGLFWAINPAGVATDWTDTEIRSINNVGRWKAEYYLAANPNVVAATQYYETMTRPLAISELMARSWATLTPAARSAVIAESANTGVITMAAGERVELSVDGTPPDAWMVPAGAFAPTRAQVHGFRDVTNRPRFNDSQTFSSVARTTVIHCSPQSQSDLHCAGNGTFSGDSRISTLQLFAYDAKDMTWVGTFGTYRLQVSP